MGRFECVWLSLKTHGAFLNVYGLVWKHVGRFECVWHSLKTHGAF